MEGQQDEQKNDTLHSWKIATHEEREKTRTFYVWFFAVFAALIAFAIWQKNFLFGVFVLLAAGTILFLSKQRSEVYEFTFTEDHLIIGNRESVYEYGAISHFDLYSFSDTDRELFIIFKEKFKPMLRVRYYKGEEEKIRDIFALKKVPQKKIEPSILDIFSKIVGV